jgi:hypothetical protein
VKFVDAWGQHLVPWGFSPYGALAVELNFGNEGEKRMRRNIAGRNQIIAGRNRLPHCDKGPPQG